MSSSSSLIDSINFGLKQISIYMGIPIFLFGVIGGILDIIIFSSLKTFRQSSCAFYLLMMSIFDLGRFYSSILFNIMHYGFEIQWDISSLFICKLRVFIFNLSSLCSMSCLCFAIIDQYFATYSRLRCQQWCNIKLAHRLIILILIIWSLHAIPYALFYNHIFSLSTNQTICQITNIQFIRYHTYIYFIFLYNILPIITVIFACLAYRNARNLMSRSIPLIRRELDRQLTVMVLIQVLINFYAFLPYSIESIFALMILTGDVFYKVPITLASYTTYYISVLGYAVRKNFVFGLYFDAILESILHIYVYIETISSTIETCFIRTTSQTISNQSSSSQSNRTSLTQRSRLDFL
jgi:hypothetical protein